MTGMHHIMFIWYWIFVLALLLVLALAIYVYLIFLDELVKIKGRPREPMEWCHRHGFYRKKHTLQLFGPEFKNTDAHRVCPTCYKEALEKAGKPLPH